MQTSLSRGLALWAFFFSFCSPTGKLANSLSRSALFISRRLLFFLGRSVELSPSERRFGVSHSSAVGAGSFEFGRSLAVAVGSFVSSTLTAVESTPVSLSLNTEVSIFRLHSLLILASFSLALRSCQSFFFLCSLLTESVINWILGGPL